MSRQLVSGKSLPAGRGLFPSVGTLAAVDVGESPLLTLVAPLADVFARIVGNVDDVVAVGGSGRSTGGTFGVFVVLGVRLVG